MITTRRFSWLTVALLAMAGMPGSSSAMDPDLDGNGLNDVWELVYRVAGLNPNGDNDRDGLNNKGESDAGTNPLDRNSILEIVDYSSVPGGDVKVTFSTEEGKDYQVLMGTSTDPGDFSAVGTKRAGTGRNLSVSVPGGGAGPRKFFKVAVSDRDTDNDRVSDWAETVLPGFDPDNPQSADPGVDDDLTLNLLLTAGGAPKVGLTAVDPEAFERGNAGRPDPARFRISRVGSLDPITVFFTIGASGDPNHGQPGPGDYRVTNANGEAAGGFVQIPYGAAAVEIVIHPTPDAIHEFPERVKMMIDEHSDYERALNFEDAIDIFDKTDSSENEVLFVGLLSSERGAETNATGVGTLFLNGKKNRARVGMTFSGLTSIQTAAHVHHSTLNGQQVSNGPVVESLPLGQVVDHDWLIRATGPYSAQQIIDALYGQNGEEPLYVNAHSMEYPGGEIWGFLSENSGTVDFQVPPDPPAIEPLDGDDLTRDVVRFLTQGTFGPTQEEIQALVDDINDNHGGNRMAGFVEWIDDQYALDQTRFYDLTLAQDEREWDLLGYDALTRPTGQRHPDANNRRMAFWHIAMNGHDQLRQRVAFALSQILVVSEFDTLIRSRHYGTAMYYDMLADHADGTYRELLYDVSKSPIMGQWLSSLKNAKATRDSQGNILIAPDENYAREIMQLFSVGLLLKHPDGSLVLDENGIPIQTYTNFDITDMAKVFTGWSFSKSVGSRGQGYPTQDNNNFNYYGGPQYFGASWQYPMKNFAAYHEPSSKTVLGTTIPAGQNGEQDLNSAVDILYNHQNTGPFIARLLIQRFVTANPSAGYIYRVGKAFTDNRTNSNQMKEVMKAILLDYEARSLAMVDNVGFGKQKEPLLRYTHLMRAFGAHSELPMSALSAYGYPAGQLDNFPPDASLFNWTTHGDSWWKQSHLRAPSVFNWFLPDQQVGGGLLDAGLVAPEFSLTNEYQAIRWVNYAYLLEYGRWIGARELPNQRETAANGGLDDPNGELDNIRAAHFVDSLEVMVQGFIDAGDTEREAFEKLLDHCDMLLCAGGLKEEYGEMAAPNPRESILDQAEYTYLPNNPSRLDLAVEDVLYLLTTSPEYIIQK